MRCVLGALEWNEGEPVTAAQLGGWVVTRMGLNERVLGPFILPRLGTEQLELWNANRVLQTSLCHGNCQTTSNFAFFVAYIVIDRLQPYDLTPPDDNLNVYATWVCLSASLRKPGYPRSASSPSASLYFLRPPK